MPTATATVPLAGAIAAPLLAPPDRRDVSRARACVALSVAVFAMLAPFATMPLPRAPAFIGVYQSALVVNDVITAALLFGQYRASRLAPLFVLACGYVFTAVIAAVHLLTFPGLFSASGLLGAGMQTTAWLYMAWHAAFPVFVIAYARVGGTALKPRSASAWLAGSFALLVAVIAAATAGQAALPPIMRGNGYAPVYPWVVAAVWLSSAAALGVVWRKKPRTVLDLWIMVVLCAWLCDIALAAVFNSGRFDLGFYAGRVYGLLAASFVLAVLLSQTAGMQLRLVRLVAEAAASEEHLRGEAALRAKSRELEESERRLAAVLDNATVAIFLMDERQHCVYMNAAAEKLTGYALAETRGRPLHEVVHHTRPDGTTYPLAECPIDRAFPQDNQQQGEEIFIHKDGSFYPVAFTASPIRDSAAKTVGTIIEVRDIREEQRVRGELLESEARLRDADRRKDEFLATLAHELRNPLAPISNGLEVLKRSGSDATLQARAREMMERQLAHLVRLVDDLLDVSRITRGRVDLRRERIDLSDAIRDAVEASRSAIAAAGHELEVVPVAAPVIVDGDRTRLAQIVSNLLNNAAKYTPRGGRVELRMATESGSALVSVSDTGIGIPAAKLDEIFEMFAQVDGGGQRAQGGLGIGLTLAKRLVELHEGSITGHSEGTGRGSTFTVRLPLVDAASARTPSERASKGVAPARILVADDNVDSAASLSSLLELAGHEVETAHDGAEACEKAAAWRPDVVLLDIGMPKLDGYAACRSMRAQPWGRDMRIVALTGWGQSEDRRRTQEAGFDAHLTKPATYEAIVMALEKG